MEAFKRDPQYILDILARVDERTQNLRADLVTIRNEIIENKREAKETARDLEDKMVRHIKDLRDDHDKLTTDVSDNYVRKESFSPVQKLVFGLVGIILATLIGSAIKLWVLR
jgi:predicted Holliday junction resolvase-like endonuclease